MGYLERRHDISTFSLTQNVLCRILYKLFSYHLNESSENGHMPRYFESLFILQPANMTGSPKLGFKHNVLMVHGLHIFKERLINM